MSVSSEVVPSGGTAQIKISLAAPAPVAQGVFSIRLDPSVFGSPTGVGVFSAAGDAAGYAMTDEGSIRVWFSSATASAGATSNLPLAVITVPVLESAAASGRVPVNAEATEVWTGPGQTKYAEVNAAVGYVSLDGHLSVAAVSPAGGLLRAGSNIRVLGTGFGEGMQAEMEGVQISNVRVIDSRTMELTLGAPAEIGGKCIRLRTADGEQVEHYPVLPAIRVSVQPFAGAIPLPPVVSFPAGRSAYLNNSVSGWVALANTNDSPVVVVLQGIDILNRVAEEREFSLEPGSTRIEEIPGAALSQGARLKVLSTEPVRMLQLTQSRDVYPPHNIARSALALTPDFVPGVAFGNVGSKTWTWRIGSAPPPPFILNPTSNAFSEPLSYKVAVKTDAGEAWLSALPATQIVCPIGVSCRERDMALVLNTTSLKAGIYRATVRLTPVVTNSVQRAVDSEMPVALTVLPQSQALRVAAGPVEFNRDRLTDSGLLDEFHLPGSFSLDVWTAGTVNWLAASASASATPATIHFRANPTGLNTGAHYGWVRARGTTGETAFAAVLWLRGGPDELQKYGIEQFSVQSGDAQPASRAIPVRLLCLSICSPESLLVTNWTASVATTDGRNWLRAERAGSDVVVHVDPRGLPVGLFTGLVTVESPGLGSTQIPIALNVWEGIMPALAASEPRLTFFGLPTLPQSKRQIYVRTDYASLPVTANSRPEATWLRVSTERQTTPTGLDVIADATGLGPGTYETTIAVSVPNQTVEIPIALVVQEFLSSTNASPLLGSIVNAASGRLGAIAPGEVITIRGIGLGPTPAQTAVAGLDTTIGGARLFVNGEPVPLLYASDGQLNAVLPDSLAPGEAAIFQVRYARSSAVWGVPVAEAAPGVFTVGGSGAGQASALNEDGSSNGALLPAARGSIIRILATGLGASGSESVVVKIGGADARVVYADAREVHAIVPEDVPPGSEIPLVVSVGSFASQPGVTLAVR